MAWIWVSEALVRAVHGEQLAQHGGAAGVRDGGLLASALGRPQNLVACGDPDCAALAASLAWGIARNHPFVDGNTRSAFVAGALFMELNGFRLVASEADVVLTFLALAAGDVSEATLADWFRANSRPR